MAKPGENEEGGKIVGTFRSGKKAGRKERHACADRVSIVDNNTDTRSGAEETVKRKTLQELQKECPPGFRKFELEVKRQTIDEDIAL